MQVHFSRPLHARQFRTSTPRCTFQQSHREKGNKKSQDPSYPLTCCTTGPGPIPPPPWPPRRLLARHLHPHLRPSCRLGWERVCFALLAPLVLVAASPTVFRFHDCRMLPSSALINGELRYPPAKLPIGNPIIPTRCGCVRIGFVIGRGQYVLLTARCGVGD